AVHREPLARLQQRQGGDEAAEPEQMIDVAMGQQHAIEAAQAEAALQQLALRALAAVDQKAAPFVHDEERRQPPLDRGHAAGSAKEHDLEQDNPAPNPARPIMAS